MTRTGGVEDGRVRVVVIDEDEDESPHVHHGDGGDEPWV